MDREYSVELPYEVRWARPEEWSSAMTLIWKTFLKFEGKDYTEEGIRHFFEFITDDNLHQAFLKGTYQMMVALDSEQIIGAASIRNRNHLSLLFVDERYHKRGVGKALMSRLCEYLKTEEGERRMTLKAAPYAVDFYRKIGFHPTTNKEEVYSGIRVTSMEKTF